MIGWNGEQVRMEGEVSRVWREKERSWQKINSEKDIKSAQKKYKRMFWIRSTDDRRATNKKY